MYEVRDRGALLPRREVEGSPRPTRATRRRREASQDTKKLVEVQVLKREQETKIRFFLVSRSRFIANRGCCGRRCARDESKAAERSAQASFKVITRDIGHVEPPTLCDNGRRTRLITQQGALAKAVGGCEGGDKAFLACVVIGFGTQGLRLPPDNQIEDIPLVALVEDVLTLLIPSDAQGAAQMGEVLLGEGCKGGHTSEHCKNLGINFSEAREQITADRRGWED